MFTKFIIIELVKIFLFWGILYATGCLVHFKNLKVNYSRKVVHFACFFLPPFVSYLFPYENAGLNDLGYFISFLVYMLSYSLFSRPIREKAPFINRMFQAIDRPEDRPHTVRWLITQTFFGAIVMTLANVLLRYYNYGELLILISPLAMVGDGLAEPVGVRFGRHKYSAYALFSKKKYHRTLEGSATIVAATILVLFLFRHLFSPQEFLLALLIIPLGTALAEAFAPHTWDTPFLFTSSAGLLFLIKQLPLL